MTSGSRVIIPDSQKKNWSYNKVKYQIGNIRVGLRIMPSANTEDNIIMMNYIRNTKTEDEGGNVDKSYHLFSDTKNYFATLNIKEDYVPFGDPEPYCFHLSWATLETSKMADKYEPFDGLNKCSLVNKGHHLWHSYDPHNGIDIKMWRENVFNLPNCGEKEDCQYE